MLARLLLLAATLPALLVLSDETCSGHGQQVDGKCVCTAPLPNGGQSDYLPGYVGDDCAQEVHPLYLTGQDVQQTCPAGKACNVLGPGERVCLAGSIQTMLDTDYHMDILLKATNADARVMLYGLLVNFTADTDPSTSATVWSSQLYPNSTTPYSLTLRTTHNETETHLHLTRRMLGWGAYNGMFLCLESQHATIFELRVATGTCPLRLLDDGTRSVCSGRGQDDCPRGSCTCPAPYAPPPNWVATPGLGFEDCSATLQPLLPAAPATVTAQAPGTWSFFEVDVKGVFEMTLTVAATAATEGTLELYGRHQLLPAAQEGAYDAASSGHEWWSGLTTHLTLRKTDGAFQEGTWYIGAYNRGPQPVTYSASASTEACPGGCSGVGTCDAASAACTCASPSAAAADCSTYAYNLTLGAPLESAPRAFMLDHVMLQGVMSGLASPATSDLVVSVSFQVADAAGGAPAELPAWYVGRPMLLVATSDTGSAIFPEGASARLILDKPGQEYAMDVGPWMLVDDALHLTLFNPLPATHLIGYKLAVSVKGTCLNACSGHGTCNNGTGLCACEANWDGGDCSVDLSQFKPANATQPACSSGTTSPRHVADQKATCWAPCMADQSGFDPEACADFTCDDARSRRKGSALECVTDACLPGNYMVTDAAGNSACLKACTCPDDGGACSMGGACLPGSTQCLNGLTLVTDPTEQCVPPMVPVCDEGALRKAYAVEGGAAMGLCTCPAGPATLSCGFTQPDNKTANANGVVVCGAGYELQGTSPKPTTLSDGTLVTTGGRCVRAVHHPRGVSGGMVFFYCLLSIALAAGLVVGSKYGVQYYEQIRYGNSIFSQGYISWARGGTSAPGGGNADDW